MSMIKSEQYYCRYCGCCTTSSSGNKPPVKTFSKCKGNPKTGLHSWVKG